MARPEEPIAPLVDVDPPDGAGVGMLAVTRLTADPGNLIDNFLDVAHFPFVTAGTFGLEQDPTRWTSTTCCRRSTASSP